jgi:hypothetical protein
LGVTSGYDGDSFNVFPCWINDGDYEMDIYYFQKGYTNYNETYGGGEQ